ncbi:MAG: rhodanese-like domain-containing protein [Bacteroidetes bacterium]|nr:rhodanese-like domain-containing protein [Bacteroidota bacterium]MDA1149039.1 rhodanese-like domain-containing protein [Bacteroidota bacterium]
MNLTQEEWTKRLAESTNAVVLDVRTADEVAQGKIEGAIVHDIFDAAGFMEAVSSFDPSKEYFVYCRSGNRSGQACAILRSQGIENAYNLMGGMLDWQGDLV